ncbi:hypothetical protein [Fibrella aestuarina]|uniref:hypothetical protein n=1 Tax=Fibrella aestuarina TaxID=651143 RepID=UPI00059E9835|nr:hypothetical protein [Fibrella aestuarina]
MKALRNLLEALLWLVLIVGLFMGMGYVLQGTDIKLPASEKRAFVDRGLIWMYGTTGVVAFLAICGNWLIKKLA